MNCEVVQVETADFPSNRMNYIKYVERLEAVFIGSFLFDAPNKKIQAIFNRVEGRYSRRNRIIVERVDKFRGKETCT